MAIGNITPDSFYSTSRLLNADYIAQWAFDSLQNGASILDIGGCSTRPGSTAISTATEWERVSYALTTLREAVPEAQLSLDTFRPEIAKMALEQFGPMIIKPLTQLAEIIEDALSSMANLSKSFRTFSTEHCWFMILFTIFVAIK